MQWAEGEEFVNIGAGDTGARVRVAAMVDGRTTQPGTIDGKQWKQQLRAGWFDGTTRLEASSFAGAMVETEGTTRTRGSSTVRERRCAECQRPALRICFKAVEGRAC
jgi:hypothetical protein